MRKLIRRLQKAADPWRSAPMYSPLLVGKCSSLHGGAECNTKKKSRSASMPRFNSLEVPEGYLPVYVGKELTRFVISARFLNHPVFAELLQRSAQEYGYEQKGGLKIPCDVKCFEHIVNALINDDADDPILQHLRLNYTEDRSLL